MEFDEQKVFHHHVPRFYLKAWAEDNRVWWSGYGKIKQSELTVVGGENDFYRLEDLNSQDLSHLRTFINCFPPQSFRTNLNFLQRFTRPQVARNILIAYDPNQQIAGEEVKDWLKALDIEMSNAVENYHMGIENIFQPYLNLMLADDVSFYQDDGQAADFLYGLMMQQVRTRRMREVLTGIQSLFVDMRAVWNVLHQIVAANAGANLYQDRRQFKIVLLNNHTNLPFITGDQPVINLHGDPKDHTPPVRLELYYPLSPMKAMLFLENASDDFSIGQEVTIDQAYAFNQRMVANSFKQVFARSEDVLKTLGQEP